MKLILPIPRPDQLAYMSIVEAWADLNGIDLRGAEPVERAKLIASIHKQIRRQRLGNPHNPFPRATMGKDLAPVICIWRWANDNLPDGQRDPAFLDTPQPANDTSVIGPAEIARRLGQGEG